MTFFVPISPYMKEQVSKMHELQLNRARRQRFLDILDQQLLRYVDDDNAAEIEERLKSGAHPDGSPSGIRPLLLATARGFFHVVQLLIKYGASVDVQSAEVGPCETGERALHVAAYFSRTEILRYLLERGADPSLPRIDGRTPLHAASTGDITGRACVDVVRLLLDAGGDPSAKCMTHGYTALHAAAHVGNVQVCQELLSRSPSLIDAHDKSGKSALFVAASEGRTDVVACLLEAGTSRVAGGGNDSSALLGLATLRGQIPVVRLLLDNTTVHRNDPQEKNVTCLAQSCALLFKRAKILEMLLQVGAQENSELHYWDPDISMLHAAVGFGDILATHVLLAAGVRETLRDKQGNLPHEVIGQIDKSRYTREFKNDDKEIDALIIPRDARRELTLRHMLARGPAYRARSWAWPSKDSTSENNAPTVPVEKEMVEKEMVEKETVEKETVASAASTLAAARIRLDVRIFRRRRRDALFCTMHRYVRKASDGDDEAKPSAC